MKRRTLADDIANTCGSRLVTVEQLVHYTGRSRSTVERGICANCTPFCVKKQKLYHVTDVAAVLDVGGQP